MDDLFVKDIERKFGDTGYAFWFKTLELIGAHGQAGKLSISWANYLDKLHKSRTKAEELLSFCQTNAKLSFTDDGETINIECRKFAEIADNYTKYDGASTKRLQRQSKVSTKQEVEEDKEVEEKKIKEPKETLGEFANVFLTRDERGKLIATLGDSRFQTALGILSAYKKSKGREYKSDYATFFTWVIKELEKRENNGSTSQNSGRYHFDKSKYPTLNKQDA